MKELNSPILVITGGGSNGGKVMKRLKVAKISAMLAHLLTWIPFAFFLFMPAYRGTEITTGGTVQKTATLVEMNGPWVVLLLLKPSPTFSKCSMVPESGPRQLELLLLLRWAR